MGVPRVAMVLVNFNGAKFQNDCVRTIKNIDYENYEIIVVDNGSTDNSIDLLKEEFPEVKIIRLPENTGVTGGNNVGMKYALENKFDYVLLLNNDTEVDSLFLKKMVCFAEKNKCCVVPKIYFYDEPNKIWFAGCKMNWIKGAGVHFDYKTQEHNFENIRELECANTCCLLIPTEVVKNVGYMDEEYFMYYDDTDYCVRIIRNGFKIYYIPEAKIWHKVSSSSGGDTTPFFTYYFQRNKRYFMRKNCKSKFVYLSFKFYSGLSSFIKNITDNDEIKRARAIGIKHYKNGKMGKQKWDI